MHSWSRRKKGWEQTHATVDAWRIPDWVRLKYFQKINSVFSQLPSISYLLWNVSESEFTFPCLKRWRSFFFLVSFDENDNGEIKEPILSRNNLNNTKDQRIKQHWIEGVFMYFVSPYIFCEGVPSLHSHTSGLSWSGPNYHSSNRPALRCPTQHCSP